MIGVCVRFKALSNIPAGYKAVVDSNGIIVKDSKNRIVIAK